MAATEMAGRRRHAEPAATALQCLVATMNHPDVSVIICTHNPRPGYLAVVLDALRRQSLVPARWELVLVDNASQPPVDPALIHDFKCAARVCVESELGLTPARLRGVEETSGDVLVFVDDDNVLSPDYLESALEIARRLEWVGVFAGNVALKFEEPEPCWFRKYRKDLAERSFSHEVWANFACSESTCCGAGIVVRRAIAEKWVNLVQTDARRQLLGRRGKSLLGGEDTDLVYTAHADGWLSGHSPKLKMDHMIPPRRVTIEYVVNLRRSMIATCYILAAVHGLPLPPRPSWPRRATRFAFRWITTFGVDRAMWKAYERGLRDGQRLVREFERASVGAPNSDAAMSNA